MNVFWTILTVVLIIAVIVLVVLYFLGRRLEKRQVESQAIKIGRASCRERV